MNQAMNNAGDSANQTAALNAADESANKTGENIQQGGNQTGEQFKKCQGGGSQR
jgi:hypothetical protein